MCGGCTERQVMVKSVNVVIMWTPTVLLSVQEMEKDILCSSTKLALHAFWQGCLPGEVNAQASYYAAAQLSC